MTNPVWPLSLPQKVLAQGFEETMPKNVIRTSMDIGPDKVRRRTTSNVREISVTVQMTISQKATFEEFFLDTVHSGASSFDWVDPLTQAEVTFRFREPPKISYVGGVWINVSMKLERMP